MRLPKTRYRRITISDFRGGLNTELSEVEIKENEFSVFQNVVLGNFGVRLRGGFQIEYGLPQGVLSAFVWENKIYLIFENGEFGVYDTVDKSYTSIGTITDQISTTPKMVWFDPAVVLTVGDSVWIYDTSANSLTKTNSPPAKDLLVKYGRIVIASGDEVWMSRVGDASDWTVNSSDASAAQFFQIGYKEGKLITAINHFLDDILVFKEDRIYLLSGMSSVQLLNSKRGAINNWSTVSLMSDVYAIDKNGFYSVVKDRFIDVVAGDLDLKVKTFFKENIDSNVKIFYSPTLRAFIIKGKREIFLYFYEYGSFSIFQTKLPIEFFVDDGKLYGLKGVVLYSYSKDNPYDSFSVYISDNINEISASQENFYKLEKFTGIIKSKQFIPNLKSNVIRFGFSVKDIESNGGMGLTVGKKTASFNFVAGSPYIYDSSGYIADDYEQIGVVGKKNFSKHFHCNQVVDSFGFYLSFNAPLSVQNVFIDYTPMEA